MTAMPPPMMPGPEDVDWFLTPRVTFLNHKDPSRLVTQTERDAIADGIRDRGGDVPGELYDTIVEGLSAAKASVLQYYALADDRVYVSGGVLMFTEKDKS